MPLLLTKKFWKTKIFLSLDCSGEIQFNNNQTLINSSLIDYTYQFQIEKLYEEAIISGIDVATTMLVGNKVTNKT